MTTERKLAAKLRAYQQVVVQDTREALSEVAKTDSVTELRDMFLKRKLRAEQND